MKIEDTPFAFSGQSPIEKLKRPGQVPNVDATLDDLDLSFLDLLTSVAADPQGAEAVVIATVAPKAKVSEPAKKTETVEKPKLSIVPPRKTETLSDSEITQVKKDMTLLSTDLTASDAQYLKQVVIPGLPILMGSVPFESIFPAGGDGEISYKGFDVSSKLADLIQKGYKSGQPIRVELDPQSAIVLKIRNGQVSAEFVSAEKGMAMVMQQELDQLRNRMLLKNLPVGNLEYKYRDPAQAKQEQSQNAEDENT